MYENINQQSYDGKILRRETMTVDEKNRLQEFPVIMMLKVVMTNAGQKVGTLIDLAYDTNYITHEAAGRLRLRGKEIHLVVHGVGKMAIVKI